MTLQLDRGMIARVDLCRKLVVNWRKSFLQTHEEKEKLSKERWKINAQDVRLIDRLLYRGLYVHCKNAILFQYYYEILLLISLSS